MLSGSTRTRSRLGAVLLPALLVLGASPSAGEPARVAYVSLGGYYPSGLSRVGGYIVAAVDGGGVAVVDPRSYEVVETYEVGPAPEEVVADRSNVYVLHRAGRDTRVSIVSRNTGAVVRTSAPGGRDPVALAVDGSRGVLYAASFSTRSVSVLDQGSLEVVRTIEPPVWRREWGYPTDLIAAPSLGAAFVTATQGFVVELRGGRPVDARKVMARYSHPSIEWIPKMRRLVVTSDLDSAIHLVSPDGLIHRRTLALGDMAPDRVAIDPRLMVAAVLGIVERKETWDMRLRFVDLRDGSIIGTTPATMGAWDVETVPGSWDFFVSDALGDGLEIHRLDGVGPTSGITGPTDELCSPCGVVTGKVTDDISGVARVVVTFSIGPEIQLERRAEMTCASRGDCLWEVRGPDDPGLYRIRVTATDRAGNVEEDGPYMDVVWIP